MNFWALIKIVMIAFFAHFAHFDVPDSVLIKNYLHATRRLVIETNQK